MTTKVAAPRDGAVATRHQFAAIGALARVEGRRLILHPAYLGVGGYLVIGGVGTVSQGIAQITRHGVSEILNILFAIFVPLIALFPASLVATSARRAGAEETLAALPVSQRGRSAALLLACLVPAAIGSAAVATGWWLDGTAASTGDHPATLFGTPFLYLGVGALAVAAARWLPWPGAALVLVVGLWSWVGVVVHQDNAFAVLTAPYLLISDTAMNVSIVGFSDAWHTAYLAGLVALASVAALYRDDLRRMFAIGIPVGALTLALAFAQLP
ncbi:MAG: hypothetical protein DLM58_11080 [Pseudonocardiales bacterium]|nr:MAG: hypothetical protein DLM58_11080 [Pseudonocardiales bacterium]